jgi:dihydrofolate reductase
VILYVASSLDGYLARPTGEVDWLFHDQDYGYEQFFAGISTIVLGRKTYEQLLFMGGYPYPGVESYVFSRRQTGQDENGVNFVCADPTYFISELKASPGKDIWLLGGGELIHSFMNQRLVDEYAISVHPVILGDGIPLFRGPLPHQDLVLRGVKSYDSGLLQINYTRQFPGKWVKFMVRP